MKMKTVILGVGLSLALGAATTCMAQNGPGRGPNGRGYGGPPANEQERIGRQESCPQGGQGTCIRGGQGQGCRWGQGQGKGAGNGWRRGACDGTGPRNGNGSGKNQGGNSRTSR